MKGNKLIATSIASAMLVAGMAMPALAVDSATEVRYSEKYVSSPAIAIDLRNGESELTREKLATLVSDRYHTTLVSVKNANGEIVTANSGRVGTGSIANLGNGKTVTVVLYGDINKDGAIDFVDAQAIYNNYHVTSLPAEQAKAADLTGDDTIDYTDAQQVFNYVSPAGYTGLVANLDKLPAEESIIANSNFTVTVAEDNVVNERENKAVQLRVVPKEVLKTDKQNVYVTIVNAKGTIVKNKLSVSNLTKNTTEYTLDLGDLSLADGTYTAVLGATENGKDNDLASFSFQVLTAKPVSVNVTTRRPYTYEARMSLDAYSVYGTVSKVYYAQTQNGVADSLIDAPNSTVKSLPLSGNRLDDQVIFTTELTQYASDKVYYVVEDVYGNRSVVNEDAVIITTDGPLDDNVDVYKVTLDDFTKKTIDNVKFEFELEDDVSAVDKTFEAVVYRNGYPIKSGIFTISSSPDKSLKGFLGNNPAELEAGDYQVTVRTLGNGTTPDSTVIAKSEVRTVSKLNPVGTPTFKITDDGKDIVEWTSEYGEEDIEGYNVVLYKYNENAQAGTDPWTTNGVTQPGVSNKVASDKKSVELTGLDPNTIYKVAVTVLDDEYLDTVDSDPVESEGFFKLREGTFSQTSPTVNSITLKVDQPVKVGDKSVKYIVSVYEITRPDETDGNPYYNYVRNVELPLIEKDGNYTLVVPNLKAGTEYGFKVTVDVEGVTGVTSYIHTHNGDYQGHGFNCTTLKAMPALSGLTVIAPVDSADKVGNNQIALDESSSRNLRVIYINGEKYEYLARDYGKDLETVHDLILNNTLRVGDVFTYTPDKLTVTLGNRSTAGTTRTFNDVASVKTLELTGDGSKREIETNVENLVLSGNDALFGLADVDSTTKVTLNNSVGVTEAETVTVAAGASVTVNGYGVTASAATELTLGSGTIAVTPNNGTNNLTFNTGDNALALTFNNVGTEPYRSTQDGKVTINSTGGTISVAGTNMYVASDIDVTISGGTLNLSDVTLDGAQTVTVSGVGTTLNVKAYAAAPIAFSTLPLKEYTTDDVGKVPSTTSENMSKVIEYLNSFGLNGTESTLNVLKDSKAVTIVYGAKTSSTVGNLTTGK